MENFFNLLAFSDCFDFWLLIAFCGLVGLELLVLLVIGVFELIQ